MANAKPQVIVSYIEDEDFAKVTIESTNVTLMQQMHQQFQELVKAINA